MHPQLKSHLCKRRHQGFELAISPRMSKVNRPSRLSLDLKKPDSWKGMEENIAQGNYSFKVKNRFNTVHYLAFKGDLKLLERAVEINGVETGSEYLESPLMVACLTGNTAAARYLLNKGANVNFVEERGHSALDFTVEVERIDVMQLLVEQKVEQKLINKAMVGASRRASYPMIELLLKYCSVDLVDGNRWSLLCQASSLGKMDIVKLLLSKGADIDFKTKNGDTPMMLAMVQGHYEMAKYLIDNGALPDISNCSESTALLIAANQGNFEMVKYFVGKGAKLDKVSKTGTALKGAVVSNNFELVKYIIETLEKLPHYTSSDLLKEYMNQPDYDRCTALIHACKHSSADMIKYLIGKGSAAIVYDKEAVSAIAIAAKHSSLESVQYLLECGWKLNKVDCHNRGILSHAASGGNVEVMKFLIENGADVNEFDGKGKYPLLLACSSKSIEAVDLLLKNGAVEDELNPAIVYAAETGNPEMVKLMLRYGSKAQCCPDENYYRELTTPLQEAVYSGSIETVKLLVDSGADPNWYQGNYSPFNCAVSSEYYDIASYLIERGARPDAIVSESGDNQLHAACYEKGNYEMFDYMLKFDSCINGQNLKGRTPLFLAAKTLDHYKVEKLVSRGAAVNILDNREISVLGAAMSLLQEMTKILGKNTAEETFSKNDFFHRTIKCLVDNGADVDEFQGEEILKWALKVEA